MEEVEKPEEVHGRVCRWRCNDLYILSSSLTYAATRLSFARGLDAANDSTANSVRCPPSLPVKQNQRIGVPLHCVSYICEIYTVNANLTSTAGSQ